MLFIFKCCTGATGKKNIQKRCVTMKLVYPAIFTPCIEKEGYTVIVPDLPGCVSEGASLVEAIEMGTDAASGWVLGESDAGNSIPPASDYKSIQHDSNRFVSLLLLDMDSYSKRIIL